LSPCHLAIFLLIVGASAWGAREEEGDPFPLRRILLPAAKLPAELRRQGEGALVRLPRPEFEKLVQEAAKAKKSSQPPRLVEARYRAALGEAPALVGTAQWKVLNPGTGAALLRLQEEGQPFNLAIKQPRYENRDALIAEFPEPGAKAGSDNRSLALLVDRPGEHTVLLEWSARAESRPEGLQADLRFPPCPVAVLEIDLPADRTLSALDGTLVSGPHPAEGKDRRLWKIACGGKAHLPLLIRRGGAGDTALLVRQRTQQKLSPDGVESQTSFTLEALHTSVRELICECDPVLRPIEVTAPGLERWEVRGNLVLISLERPLREGVVEVRCLAPLGTPATKEGMIAWTSPGMALRGGLPRGETLELSFHPDLRLASWNPGDFRLTDTSSTTDLEKKVRYSRLVLQGGGLGFTVKGGKPDTPRRPGASLQAGVVAVRAVQQGLWRLGADGMTFTVQIAYEVRQGLLFQLPVRLPAGWDVEGVETTPADLLRSSSVRKDKAGPFLLVDLRKPLGVGMPPGKGKEKRGPFLTIHLAPARDASGTKQITSRDLPFPDVIPVGAPFREGGLAIDCDEQIHLPRVRTTASLAEPPAEGPWGKTPPTFYYPFKGEPVTGTLHLRPREARFRARAFADVFVASGRAAEQIRLTLEGEGGAPSQVDVYLSAPTRGWEWRIDPTVGATSNRLRRVERLYHREVGGWLGGLAASTPVQAAILHAARPGGSFWRLSLERPLTARRGLTLRATRTLEPDPAKGSATHPLWEVPLPLVLGGNRQEGEVTLHLAGADLVSVHGSGLRESVGGHRLADGPRSASAWRSFRYADLRARLSLQVRTLHPGGVSEALVDDARLTTVLSAEGELRHHFRFRLLRWSQRSVPVRLPAGARLLAAGVNGHWLEQFTGEPRDSIDLPALVHGGEGGPSATTCEILYTTPTPVGALGWLRLESLAPVLPVTPAEFRQRWLLPPGVLPLWETGVRELPGSEAVPAPLLRVRWPTDLFRLGPVISLPGQEGARQAQARRQALTDAAAASGNPGADRRLDALIEEVAFEHLRDQHPLVLDTTALARAGVGPETILKKRTASGGEEHRLAWEDLGLIALPARSGVLLTSWVVAQQWGDRLPESIEEAVAGAVERGRDPSGRLVTALEWLRSAGAKRSESAGLFPAGESLEGWTAWEPVASEKPRAPETEAELVVVRRGMVAGLGLALAGLLAVMLVGLRHRSGGLRLRFLLCWVATAGVALVWLPASLRDLAWWPLLAGLTIALPWYLAWAGRPRGNRASPPSSSPPSSKKVATVVAGPATAGLVLLLVGSSSGPAQAPREPANAQGDTVYLVGEASAPDKQTVLVSPSLVDRLKAMARPLAPTTGVVPVSAAYDGKLVKGVAEIDAVFQVHALGEGPATLTLPLSGVQLVGDVLLDGARALPTALSGPRGGYSLRVRGSGRHKVELKFRVLVPGSEDQAGIRQVRFGVPRLVQSRLVFRVGPGSSHLQALVKHGAGRTLPEGGGQRLEAELGALAAPVQLRWYQEGKPPRPAQVEFREAYLWDLRPDASTLTALIPYSISRGAVTSLFLDLPGNLEVISALARRGGRGGPAREEIAPDPVRLSGWSVSGASTSRVLRLDFPGPVAGAIEVHLELVPRAPWAGPVVLPIPKPHGQPAAKSQSFLAYRARGLEATLISFSNIKGLQHTEDFAPFWPKNSRPMASSLTYAGWFDHQKGQSPELRLRLRPQRPRIAAEQKVTLEVGPRQAEFRVQATVKAAAKDLSLVAWEIQSARAVVVGSVSGPGVGRWCQSGDRLLVWCAKTTASTWIEIAGWMPLTLPASKKPGADLVRLDLPCFRIPEARARTTLTVRAAPGLALTPQVQTLRSLAVEGWEGASEFRYTAQLPVYAGSFVVKPGLAPSAVVRIETGLRGKELTFTGTIDCDFRGAPGRSVNLRLRDWQGDVELEAPADSISRRREQSRRTNGRRERAWMLDLAPAVRNRYRLVLRGRMPIEEAAEGVPMPEVMVVGIKAKYTFVVDNTLTAEGATGLTEVRAAGPSDGPRIWNRTGEEWGLRIMPREGPRGAPVQVLLAEHLVSVPDNRRWLHEAVFWLRHEAPAELRLSWPAEVEVTGVVIDEGPVSVLQPEPTRLWLPLSGAGGFRHVRISWRSTADEPLHHPNLTLPRLAGTESGPTVWTVDVPPGWQVSSAVGRDLGLGADRRAAVELYRAAAQLAISQDLVRRRADESALMAAQKRFVRECWLAERALQSGANSTRRIGPQGTNVGEWLRQLRKQNEVLLREHRVEEAAGSVSPGGVDVSSGARVPRGTARSWLAEGDGPPAVTLTPVAQREVRQSLRFSGQWLLLLLGVWAISLSGVLRVLLRWLWPEEVALLGVLGWQVAGPTLVVLFLLALGVAGRVLLVGRGVRALLSRPSRPAPSSVRM
jgi:hypothetical protein